MQTNILLLLTEPGASETLFAALAKDKALYETFFYFFGVHFFHQSRRDLLRYLLHHTRLSRYRISEHNRLRRLAALVLALRHERLVYTAGALMLASWLVVDISMHAGAHAYVLDVLRLVVCTVAIHYFQDYA